MKWYFLVLFATPLVCIAIETLCGKRPSERTAKAEDEWWFATK